MRRRIGNSKQNKEIDKEIDNNDKCQQVYKFLKVINRLITNPKDFRLLHGILFGETIVRVRGRDKKSVGSISKLQAKAISGICIWHRCKCLPRGDRRLPCSHDGNWIIYMHRRRRPTQRDTIPHGHCAVGAFWVIGYWRLRNEWRQSFWRLC